MSPGARTRYATRDGVDIAYQVIGDGRFDLLLYTGASVPIECMDDEPLMVRFQRRLSSFCRVLRFDRTGVGLSDRGSPSHPPTHHEWVQDGVAVLDAVGSQRAAVLAPFANAPDGVLLAATNPERVSHLVIVNGAARVRWAPDYPVGIPREVADELQRLTTDPDAIEHGYDNLAAFAPSVSNDPAFRAWWNRAGNLGATPAMARAFLAGQLEVDVRAMLPQITAPTLVIHRAEMPIVDVGHGRYLAEHIPNAKYVELSGADTFFWVGDTRAMLDAIEEFLTGTRSGTEPERVLATVLFTDIVGSTDRATQLGDHRWRNLLDRHDHVIRQQIERFRGREVNTVGDGFLATFDSPGRAIECALAIRSALEPLDVETRAGIHTGEIEKRDDDVAGVAVHIGARVASMAGPGEVLVSAAVPSLVLGSGLEFDDRGDHELKGVPGMWRIFAVTG